MRTRFLTYKLNIERWLAFKILRIENLNKVARIGEVSLTSAIVNYVPTNHWLTKRKVVRPLVPVVGNLNNNSKVCKQISDLNPIFVIVWKYLPQETHYWHTDCTQLTPIEFLIACTTYQTLKFGRRCCVRGNNICSTLTIELVFRPMQVISQHISIFR